MFWEIVTIVGFFGGVLLYIFARTGALNRQPMTDTPSNVTSSEKLYISKTNDAAFFDGESEEYAETMSRLRQYGGA